MKLYTLGTSSGTEPVQGFHHTCHAIETEKGLYFFDAGESGAYTAHLMGIDLLKTKAVFISHPHMDHVGGLGNLLWYIRKLTYTKNIPLESGNIDIFTPCVESAEGFMTVLYNTEGNFICGHTHTIEKICEGVVFDNGDIKVTAIHTDHMPKINGEYMSYAFRIECEGKMIVYSGDMRIENIKDIVPDKCDAFLVETGHNLIEDICSELKTNNKDVGKLIFVHHRKNIMYDTEQALERAKNSFGDNVSIARDGNVYEF